MAEPRQTKSIVAKFARHEAEDGRSAFDSGALAERLIPDHARTSSAAISLRAEAAAVNAIATGSQHKTISAIRHRYPLGLGISALSSYVPNGRRFRFGLPPLSRHLSTFRPKGGDAAWLVTGARALPARTSRAIWRRRALEQAAAATDYTALNATLEELVGFGNIVANPRVGL